MLEQQELATIPMCSTTLIIAEALEEVAPYPLNQLTLAHDIAQAALYGVAGLAKQASHAITQATQSCITHMSILALPTATYT